jgi:hypothetical protein
LGLKRPEQNQELAKTSIAVKINQTEPPTPEVYLAKRFDDAAGNLSRQRVESIRSPWQYTNEKGRERTRGLGDLKS